MPFTMVGFGWIIESCFSFLFVPSFCVHFCESPILLYTMESHFLIIHLSDFFPNGFIIGLVREWESEFLLSLFTSIFHDYYISCLFVYDFVI